MIVLDGIGKDIGLAFTVGLGVLLGTDHDGLGAVALVEEVDGGIEFLQLPDLSGIDIEEILLQGTARRDAVDDDSGALVLQALDEETVEQLGGCLHDGNGAVGGGDEPEFRGDLRQRLVWCEADAHGQAHGAPDALVQTLAPLLEIDALHAVEIDEALVDAVAEVGGRLLADDHHHARRQVAIKPLHNSLYSHH